ncbi:DUF6694 family lipoprotein [Rheinheimera texasensis]|uniref:DUF6694 family lipoprotein n=1 Tax=Rheinheimera texasensis TaxID=306205 RepID=UPI0004E0B10E|nr:DUF6694 family lipoprotein [Rheinheimera texasensis]
MLTELFHNRVICASSRSGKSLICALLLLAVQGCAAPQSYRTLTIDGSNSETTQQSVQRVVRSMPESQQAEFLLALVKIQVHAGQMQAAALLQSDTAIQHVNYQFLGQQTHGLTAQQVIAKAAALP